jgi:hypothetical protein
MIVGALIRNKSQSLRNLGWQNTEHLLVGWGSGGVKLGVDVA